MSLKTLDFWGKAIAWISAANANQFSLHKYKSLYLIKEKLGDSINHRITESQNHRITE